MELPFSTIHKKWEETMKNGAQVSMVCAVSSAARIASVPNESLERPAYEGLGPWHRTVCTKSQVDK